MGEDLAGEGALRCPVTLSDVELSLGRGQHASITVCTVLCELFTDLLPIPQPSDFKVTRDIVRNQAVELDGGLELVLVARGMKELHG